MVLALSGTLVLPTDSTFTSRAHSTTLVMAVRDDQGQWVADKGWVGGAGDGTGGVCQANAARGEHPAPGRPSD